MTRGSGNDYSKDESKVRAAIARAESLSPEQRRAIGKKGAAARWRMRPVRATHKGNFKEEFGIDVDCYVLADEQKTAVISQRGMAAALGRAASGSSLPRFVQGQKIAPYVGAELAEKLANPLILQWSTVGSKQPPAIIYGYDVTMLIDVCKAVIAAAADGNATTRQAATVKQAHVILNASAKAGIKGLVYALAGYDQTKEEYIAAFKLYVSEEARQYEQEFPTELYEQWYRLYGIPKPQRGKNWKLKQLTIDHVYVPLAGSDGKILSLLRDYRASSGDRARAKLFQFLSVVGTKALRRHLGRILGIADTSTSVDDYEGHVARVFGRQLLLFNAPTEP